MGSDLTTFQTSAGEKNEVEIDGRVRWWISLSCTDESILTFPGGNQNSTSKESASRPTFDLGSKMVSPDASLSEREGRGLRMRARFSL